VIVRILGSAAGGGLPQWNCNCRVCASVRNGNGRAIQRTQSSIAVRADDGPWFLVNASPDLRQQLADLPFEWTNGLRTTPFAGILLTDAEIDHAAGLLLLRESSSPLEVYSTEAVRQALTKHYPLLTMLDRYCGMRWTRLEPGAEIVLGDALAVETFATGGDPPLYVDEPAPDLTAVGLTIRDRLTGGVLTYAPALEELTDDVLARLREADYAFVDGTFWTNDELVELGLGERTAVAMGHVPLSGPNGSLELLRSLATKTVLVHLNNTNPVLLDDSAERAIVVASGIEVGRDGMELRL
jgi:pyrroloquinoline quinone biosynthesis protein B